MFPRSVPSALRYHRHDISNLHRRKSSWASSSDPLVLVDSVRTPFLRHLTSFEHLSAHSLLTSSIRAIIERTRVDPSRIGMVAAGCAFQVNLGIFFDSFPKQDSFFQEPTTRNVARDSALSAGLPPRSHSAVSMSVACVSSLAAVAHCAGWIRAEEAEGGERKVAVAAGVEFLSDAPIR